jgi:prepilin-type N-terminal cleavage/methylation domain-containing protein
MKMPIIHQTRRMGFTLVEMLVTISIIAILAVLSTMGASIFIKRASAAKDASTLRQISLGIQMYASDYNDYLPGPLFTGQAPIYNAPLPNNIKEWRRLADCLAAYMGHSNPEKGDFIDGMASSWQKTPETRRVAAFYMQQTLPLGEAGTTTDCPWGRPAPAPADDRVPMKLHAVLAQPLATRTWAMTELDQLHPDIDNPPWKSLIPAGMVHENFRLALYFDNTVRKVNEKNMPF